jgi:hypothetical protein
MKFPYRDCGIGYQNSNGQEAYFGYKKKGIARMGHPLKKGRGGKNINILNAKGFF